MVAVIEVCPDYDLKLILDLAGCNNYLNAMVRGNSLEVCGLFYAWRKV